MTRREKTLGAAVAVAVGLWFGDKGVKSYQGALLSSQGEGVAAEQALSQARAEALQGERARRKLKQWQRQSLPVNVDVAESLYREWLSEQLQESGFGNPEIRDRSQGVRRQHYSELSFVVNAKGSLAQTTEFLHRFYTAPHLHRIAKATLTPQANDREKIDVHLEIDALILPDCERAVELADANVAAPPERTLDEVRENLLARNVFAPYTPKSDDAAESGAPKDWDDKAAQDALVSALTRGSLGWQVSVRFKESGDVRKYRQGDRIELGDMSLTILEVDGLQRRMLLECKDGRREVRLGQTFAESSKLGDSST